MDYLNELLRKSGVKLSDDEESRHMLTQEQSLVIRDIEKYLNKDENNIRNVVNGLKVLFGDQNVFKMGLLPTILRKVDSDDVDQDSLVRIFLLIDDLQYQVIKILIKEITRCVLEKTEEDFLRLTLNSLMHLPYIQKGEEITTEILDILDIASFESRIEILNAIPDIIPDSLSDKAGKEISKLLRESADLTPAVIDCLNVLNLSNESKIEIEDLLTDNLNNFNAIKIFPVLYEYLINNCSKQSLFGILEKCRNSLIDILSSDELENESYKVIIYDKLSHSMLNKNIQETYLNFLGKTKECKSIDILLYILLHFSLRNKKKVEILFKKQIKNEILKLNHLEEFFNKYITKFLINYLNSMINLSSFLISESKTLEFSMNFFKLIFDCKFLNFNQRRDLIHNLIMLMGVDVKNVTEILKILKFLSENEKMRENSHQIMLLLDNLELYSIEDVKMVFDVLCLLICSDENYSGLKNELHILIRKQLTTSKASVKQFGIIGGLIMIKYVLINNNNENEGENLEIKECKKLLNLIENACENSTSLIGLFYDQLADIIRSSKLNGEFLKYLDEKITNDFQNKYIIENIPSSNELITFIERYSLNTTEEIDSEIYINIGELTLKKDLISANISIEILAPFFRLLRLLHYIQNNGELQTIDALLGCGIILPEITNIENYSIEELKLISDCLYHCSSWFREVISAFVTQKSRNIRRKVLQRLKNLVEVENTLDDVMKRIPQHKLPLGSFYFSQNQNQDQKITKNLNKKTPKPKRQKLDLNETTLSVQNVNLKKKNINITYNFRQIDTDVMILLKYPLKLESGDLEELSQTQQTTIDLFSFDFLLKDLSKKLETSTSKIKAEINPLNIITDCVKLLPNIFNKFQVIWRRLTKTLEENDFIYDHQSLYTLEINDLKKTSSSVLKCFHLIFNWNGFKNQKHIKLLKECLNAFKITTSSSKFQSINQLSKELVGELTIYTNQSLHLTSAVYLIKIMENLFSITLDVEINKKIASSSLKLLSRPWYDFKINLETGKEHLTQIDYLIQSYLKGANVKTLGGLISNLQEESTHLKTKEDNLPMLKAITKTNFYVLYRQFCICLLERVKIEVLSLTNTEHLILWKTTALSLQGLMEILKVQESHSNLIHFFKKSIGILKVFLSHGIPIMEIVLRSKTDKVIEILKTLQLTIRFLHHLCCHSKITKDTSLIAHVPRFRLTLETFIFRVKAMLVANDCSAAFWMGNLRNRDLHGEEIISQNSITTDDNGDDGGEDEELPLDDESDDEDGEDLSGDVEERSASEIFD